MREFATTSASQTSPPPLVVTGHALAGICPVAEGEAVVGQVAADSVRNKRVAIDQLCTDDRLRVRLRGLK